MKLQKLEPEMQLCSSSQALTFLVFLSSCSLSFSNHLPIPLPSSYCSFPFACSVCDLLASLRCAYFHLSWQHFLNMSLDMHYSNMSVLTSVMYSVPFLFLSSRFPFTSPPLWFVWFVVRAMYLGYVYFTFVGSVIVVLFLIAFPRHVSLACCPSSSCALACSSFLPVHLAVACSVLLTLPFASVVS